MYKLLSILLLIKIVASATGKDSTIKTYQSIEYHYNNNDNIDGYIYLNEQKNVQNIQNCDVQMRMFRERYIAEVDTMNTTSDILVATVVQTEELFKMLELSNELGKRCVSEFRPLLPPVAQIKQDINVCIKHARQQVDALLKTPLEKRNALNSYYKNIYEDGINKCKQLRNSNTTRCVLDEVSHNNNYTLQYKKAFDMAMDAAECSAKINIKEALDCSFVVESHTIALNSKVNSFVNNCLVNNYCEPNNTTCYSCSDVYYMQYVSPSDNFIENPFKGKNAGKSCIMLKT